MSENYYSDPNNYGYNGASTGASYVYEKQIDPEIESAKKTATASFVLGALSLMGSVAVVSGILGIIGIVLSNKARSKGLRNNIDTAGMVCSVLGLIMSALFLIVWISSFRIVLDIVMN